MYQYTTILSSNDYSILAGIVLGLYIVLRLILLARDAFGIIKE
jgi:hypothetical protein